MTTISKTRVSKDMEAKTIRVEREFDAPVEKVWRAWTDSSMLDQWWAPHPWRAETKSMDFRPGGFWLYCMRGPANESHWARVDYQTIEKLKHFEAMDSFCDENGIKTSALPSMNWRNDFQGMSDSTKVIVNISFDKEADIRTLLEMGFEQGFTSAMDNLDELLAK
jgi:uncharacterized protein YndB with AHSA1/START domain